MLTQLDKDRRRQVDLIHDSLRDVYNLNLDGGLPIEIPSTTRETLCHMFRQFGFRVGAEIGVERGYYSAALCERIPGLHLYCVDAWKAYRGYRDHVTQEKLEGFVLETKKRLAPYHVTYLRDFSTEAAQQVPDGSLDFVYIDGNHARPYVQADLTAWIPKVRVGGVVSGHDYARRTGRGYINDVVDVVHEWTAAHEIRPWFVLGKKIDVVRDHSRSFFWVKSA